MRHRLLQWWPVLWTTFGVRPGDVGDLTLTEVLAIEHYLTTHARR